MRDLISTQNLSFLHSVPHPNNNDNVYQDSHSLNDSSVKPDNSISRSSLYVLLNGVFLFCIGQNQS